MGKKPGDPKPGVSSLERDQGMEVKSIEDMLIMLTLNGSFHPASRVRRRGEKSLAGLTADPAVNPKL